MWVGQCESIINQSTNVSSSKLNNIKFIAKSNVKRLKYTIPQYKTLKKLLENKFTD